MIPTTLPKIKKNVNNGVNKKSILKNKPEDLKFPDIPL